MSDARLVQAETLDQVTRKYPVTGHDGDVPLADSGVNERAAGLILPVAMMENHATQQLTTTRAIVAPQLLFL